MAHRLPRLHEKSLDNNSVGKELRRFRIRQPDAHAVRCVRIPDRGHPGAHQVPRDSLLDQHAAKRHVRIADAGRYWPSTAYSVTVVSIYTLNSTYFVICK